MRGSYHDGHTTTAMHGMLITPLFPGHVAAAASAPAMGGGSVQRVNTMAATYS